MRLFVSAFLIFAFALALASVAAAQTNTARYNFDGTQTLTDMGWTLTRNWSSTAGADPIEKSKDYSTGIDDGGTLGINIKDNNVPVNAYMKMYTNPGVDQSQGLVYARIKYIGGSSNGTFGYSSANGNHSVLLGIRSNGVNIKNADGSSTTFNSGSTIAITGSTATYRVYALRWYLGGTYDVWVSNGTDWSANQSDWTQIVSGGGWGSQTALIDHNATAQSGIILGAFGSSSGTWEGNVDYVVWSKNSELQQPWTIAPVPEPSSLLALASGLLGTAGFVIRRRRA